MAPKGNIKSVLPAILIFADTPRDVLSIFKHEKGFYVNKIWSVLRNTLH